MVATAAIPPWVVGALIVLGGLVLPALLLYVWLQHRAAQRRVRALAVLTDVLKRSAAHDALTGLPNRTYLLEMLSRSLSRARRHQEHRFAVLFLDLDSFKLVNDSMGHLVGDRLLIEIGDRLAACVRPEDVIARLGGDEFAILLEGIQEPQEVTAVAERIRASVARPFEIDGHEVFTGVSTGIAFGDSGYDSAEDLLRDADIAMYRAKLRGRGGYEVFEGHMRSTAQARMQLESALRRALQRGELEVHYQPIVRLDTGRISGFEALARWRHPERGILNAAAFVPLAEETGLIVPVGQYVLRQACSQIRRWGAQHRADPRLSVSVNLSPRELLQTRMPRYIEEVLRDSDLPASALRVEVSEGAFTEASEGEITTSVLRQLGELGVQLYLDHFGTEYSSLSQLHSFPVSGVKIDRYLVHRVGTSESCLNLVRNIVDRVRELGMDAVAEGVETHEQQRTLQTLGCPRAQGMFLARPFAADEVDELLEGHRAIVFQHDDLRIGR